MVAGPAVRLFIEELRVFVPEYGIRGSVIVDYINHAAHAFIVDGIHKSPEILECTVFRVNSLPNVPLRLILPIGWIGISQMISVPSERMRSRSGIRARKVPSFV